MFNVARPKVIPTSLSAQKSYSERDVVESLEITFHGKCYICETKELLALNVEHFSAHKGCVQKKFAWDNLFYACARCNNFKRHTYDDILNCTDLNIDVLRLIRHTPPLTPYSDIIIEPMDTDPKTIRTADLISRIFNEDDTGNKSVVRVQLRKRVYKRYAKILQHINTYIDEDELPASKLLAVEHLKALMDVTQEYSAFLRWPILDSPELYKLLGESINQYKMVD
ncbi:hypothetical protein C2E19_20025 [Pseudomonas sp. DTU12.3]|uniref:hypothetical protein n=1 Tax=Pseudomonas sp. DTU12.3 TaxID=2073078 RepID=UPI001010DDC1|nr:hypothetical protein [Pseudomonas sp. DTU12.3]QAX85986.1 hypothetical protein C2E19_20025 [Pseudomonas sp. DTU12.3]